MTNITKTALSLIAIAALNGCGDTIVNQTPSNVIIDNSINDSNNAITDPTDPTDPGVTGCPVPTKEGLLSGDLSDMDLTSDTLWLIDGKTVLRSGFTMNIEPCTTIAGIEGTGDGAAILIVDKGAKIVADGTEDEPIIFTSELAARGGTSSVGQWGGITIIGNAGNSQTSAGYEADPSFVAGTSNLADNSGVLRYVKVLNTGASTGIPDKEYNGLSMVGVGSGTTIEDITIDLSNDDGIELWGGTVNLKNITITNCTDDYFDIDDGYSGTVTNLKITQELGDSAMEMSGTTVATFDGLTIIQNKSNQLGVVYFKGAGVGAKISNATITDNVTSTTNPAGAIHSDDVGADAANTSFTNVTLNGTSTEPDFTGPSATALEARFDAGTGNVQN